MNPHSDDELRALEEALAEEGREMREVLAEAEAREALAEDEALRGFRAQLEDAAPHQPPVVLRNTRFAGRPLLAAAAALLIVTVAAWMWQPRSNDPDRPHGPIHLGTQVRCVEPIGAVQSWQGFHWTLPEGAHDAVRLVIFNNDLEEIHSETLRDTSEWQYDSARHPRLPERLFWQIILLDPSGAETTQSDDCEAWLTSS